MTGSRTTPIDGRAPADEDQGAACGPGSRAHLGRTAYEARFAGETRITPWADLPEEARAVWRRVEAACTPDTHPLSPDPRTEMARLSAAAPKGPWSVTLSEEGEDPDRRPIVLLESADGVILAVDEDVKGLDCRSPALEFAAALEAAYRAGHLLPAPAPAEMAIPAGWRLVPVEPSEEMVAAGWIDKEDVDPDDIYRAMLDAAPALAEGAQSGDGLTKLLTAAYDAGFNASGASYVATREKDLARLDRQSPPRASEG